MRYELPLRHLFILLITLGWAATAWGASAIGPDLASLPWTQVGIGALLSLWGGLTRTAERALESIRGEKPFRIWLELGKDVFVSSGVGFITFAFGAWQQWGVWLLGAALWLAGYLGARLLARIGDAWLEAVAARIGDSKNRS